MAATKICKVCGREYEACNNARRVEGVYRWQDVACCPEHGSIYLEQVLAARASEPVKNTEPVVEDSVDESAEEVELASVGEERSDINADW